VGKSTTTTPAPARLTAKERKVKEATQVIPSADDKTGRRTNILYQILSMKRPAWSKMEEAMIKRFIDPHNPIIDKFGNRCVRILLPNGNHSKTMFSCHTDTVHRVDGFQKLYLDPVLQEVFVDDSNCLGADDGTGVYLMLMMIKNQVPGTYLFHRAEEIGCQGSKYVVENNADWLKQFDCCVAFDRKGEDEVIIAQAPGIIASDAFGDALAKELSISKTMKYRTSKLGSITDSGQYYNQIPECVNLSVGYRSQHTNSETQSISFIQKLLPRLINISWEELPIERKAGPAKSKYGQNYQGNQQYNQAAASNNRFDTVPEKKLAQLIMTQPRVALELLVSANITADDLWEAEWDALREQEDMLSDFARTYGAM